MRRVIVQLRQPLQRPRAIAPHSPWEGRRKRAVKQDASGPYQTASEAESAETQEEAVVGGADAARERLRGHADDGERPYSTGCVSSQAAWRWLVAPKSPLGLMGPSSSSRRMGTGRSDIWSHMFLCSMVCQAMMRAWAAVTAVERVTAAAMAFPMLAAAAVSHTPG